MRIFTKKNTTRFFVSLGATLLTVATIGESYAQCNGSELVTNGSFEEASSLHYASSWNQSGGWGHVEAEVGPIRENPNPINGGGGWMENSYDSGDGTLSQTLSTGVVSSQTYELNFDLFARNYGATLDLPAGAVSTYWAKLEIRIGGVTYATFDNSSTANSDITMTLSNGAVGTFPSGFKAGSANGDYTATHITLTIHNPSPGNQIEFVMTTNGDDFGLDNISLKGECPVPMPVRFISFTAEKNGSTNELNWNTASEIGNKGFEIQQSADAKTWKTLGFVDSHATNGDSESELTYIFTDYSPSYGYNYYRLKQIDLDGTSEYSVIRVVVFGEENVDKIMVFPNPTSYYITISELKGGEIVNIYDATGRKVQTAKGSGSIVDISLEGLKEGIYHVHIIGTAGEVSSHKVVKSN